MAGFPNMERKAVGDLVVNVHPCGRYDDAGVVLQVSGCVVEDDTLTVQIGRGSTVYGPAANWALTDQRPAWLRDEVEAAFMAAFVDVAEDGQVSIGVAGEQMPLDGLAANRVGLEG